jgi:hypothetical protein
MRSGLLLPLVVVLGCAHPQPPAAVRSCMASVTVTAGNEPAPSEVLTQSTAACGLREICVETLRKRACEIGGRAIVIQREAVGGEERPPSNAIFPVASSRGKVADTYIQITAWIVRGRS